MSVLDEFAGLPSRFQLAGAVKQGQLYAKLVALARQDTSYPLAFISATMLQQIDYDIDLTNEREVKEVADRWYGEQAAYDKEVQSAADKKMVVLYTKFIGAVVKYVKEMGWTAF